MQEKGDYGEEQEKSGGHQVSNDVGHSTNADFGSSRRQTAGCRLLKPWHQRAIGLCLVPTKTLQRDGKCVILKLAGYPPVYCWLEKESSKLTGKAIISCKPAPQSLKPMITGLTLTNLT